VLNQQLSCTANVVVVHRSHQQATATQIGIQTSAGDQPALVIDFSNSQL